MPNEAFLAIGQAVDGMTARVDAIVGAAETDTVFLNRHSRPGLRALRTERTTELERQRAAFHAEDEYRLKTDGLECGVLHVSALTTTGMRSMARWRAG